MTTYRHPRTPSADADTSTQHITVESFPDGRTHVLALLRAATAAEARSSGVAKRDSFRVTRNLFGGAAVLGMRPAVIAEALGVRAATVRNRTAVDGLVTAVDFARLAGIDRAQVDSWSERGWIVLSGPDAGDTRGFRASSLIVALLRQLDAPDR